ncbi:hypothetical protein [Rathayibacter sp. AY1E1]|uniref:hypothetical protein n=1 Tax=Rathayibacter sp. AY1E1 TaxID=2080549 RepID=UPI0011B09DD3|nr:hypothetical protein [Rathayibacter sp. AY1E1]
MASSQPITRAQLIATLRTQAIAGGNDQELIATAKLLTDVSSPSRKWIWEGLSNARWGVVSFILLIICAIMVGAGYLWAADSDFADLALGAIALCLAMIPLTVAALSQKMNGVLFWTLAATAVLAIAYSLTNTFSSSAWVVFNTFAQLVAAVVLGIIALREPPRS